MKFSREIELRGHIVDSGILAKVMDCVVEYNGDFETEEFTLGRQKADPSYARMQISAETPEQLTQIEFGILIEIIENSRLQPNAGVKEALEALRAEGLSAAVASSSDRVYVETVLRVTGLEKLFDATACGNEVAAAKPAPDVYLKALQLLGVSAGEAVAVEDSDTGAKAAVAAHLLCIGYDAVSDEKFRQKLGLCACKIGDMHLLPQTIRREYHEV